MRVVRRVFLLAVAGAFCAGAPKLTSDQQAVIDHVSANSLRGHLSFIASDLLEGRATPSRGLDLAADYIAAQFRRAGLEPLGKPDYFQVAPLRGGTAKNVAGLLRGSDPALKDTYIILSAHYDHIGMRSTGDDRIFNGANDDGSGTVSVIEIASALAALPVHPKRSILFLAFFGEEKDLLGSHYYARHPLVPLDKTIAEINLEQVGRTDATNGPQIGVAYFTGFDFSSLGQVIADGADAASFRIAPDPSVKKEDLFERSDNLPFAEAGIPDGTVFIADDFPDYHRVGDEWQKIEYENMAKLDRALALGLLRLATDPASPHWNTALPGVQKYVHASQ